MNNQLKSTVQNTKTGYIFGFKVFIRKNTREYIFDTHADYNKCFYIKESTVFSLFKLRIYEVIRGHDVISYLLFNFKVRTMSLAKKFFRQNLEKINIDFDDAYILSGGSGETFLWAAYAAKNHFSINKSKKPIIVGGRDSYESIIKMYLPNVPYFANKSRGSSDTENSYTSFKFHNFYFCYANSLQKNYTYLAFNCSYLADVYYVVKGWSLNGIQTESLKYSEPLISRECKEGIYEKISEINLNIENFIILAYEANTSIKPPSEFWNKIINKFKNLGVDVFINFINHNNYIPGGKYLLEPLYYDEIFELAKKAKAVISLRSGFSETMLPAQTPSIVIVTPLNTHSIKPIIKSKNIEISINNIPFVKKKNLSCVYYYDYESNDDAVDEVLSCFLKMTKNQSCKKEDMK